MPCPQQVPSRTDAAGVNFSRHATQLMGNVKSLDQATHHATESCYSKQLLRLSAGLPFASPDAALVRRFHSKGR